MIEAADFGRLSRELQEHFPNDEPSLERLDWWLAKTNIDKAAFDGLVAVAIDAFKEMMVESAAQGGDAVGTVELPDGSEEPMIGIDVGNLIGSICCNMFILGYETASQYGRRS